MGLRDGSFTLMARNQGVIRSMAAVKDRIADVRLFRLKSKSASTRKLSETPTRFHVTVVPDRPFLVIPEVSSERRDYVPIGWLESPVIPSNLVRLLLDADLWHFGVLTSTMHMAWLRQIGGRLESRYRYSIGIVYNPFPWPEVTEQQRTKVRGLAQSVLDARIEFPNATLADLYDADAMPPKLRKAHSVLDEAVDKLYRTAAFAGDRDRVEFYLASTKELWLPWWQPQLSHAVGGQRGVVSRRVRNPTLIPTEVGAWNGSHWGLAIENFLLLSLI